MTTDILTQLVITLPAEIKQIQQALDLQDMATLRRLTHRLHGALCYCGVPRLKAATVALEAGLNNKSDPAAISDHVLALFNESEKLVAEFSLKQPIDF